MPMVCMSVRVFVLRLHVQQVPELADGDSLDRKHAVLQAVQILPMHRRYELPRYKRQEDLGRDVMLAQSMAELRVL
jgi:hypothetical protein